eukprot:1356582-Pyramimonas_sp.AAC.2
MEEGGDRDAEVMEAAFEALSFIFKFTQRKLAADLPLALRITRCLRHQKQEYVRSFACEAVAFLLRSAPDSAVPEGIAALLAEISPPDPAEGSARGERSDGRNASSKESDSVAEEEEMR